MMSPVATTSAVQPHPVTVNRPNMVSVGTIVWLSSELMFFAGLFAMYFTIRAVVPDLWDSQPELFNIPFAVVNTIVLVMSSVTCQMGVFAAERYQPYTVKTHSFWKRWGMVEWFYLTTGFHALHVTGGLVAFLLVIGRAYAVKNFGRKEMTTSIVVSYYWHFVDVVWIALFFVIYFLK